MGDRLLHLNFSPSKQKSAATGLFDKIGCEVTSSNCIRHTFGKWPSQKGLALDVLREFPQIRKSYRISPDGIGSLLSGWVRPLKSRKRRFLSQKCSFCWAVIGFWPPWFPTGSVERERERGAHRHCSTVTVLCAANTG